MNFGEPILQGVLHSSAFCQKNTIFMGSTKPPKAGQGSGFLASAVVNHVMTSSEPLGLSFRSVRFRVFPLDDKTTHSLVENDRGSNNKLSSHNDNRKSSMS